MTALNQIVLQNIPCGYPFRCKKCIEFLLPQSKIPQLSSHYPRFNWFEPNPEKRPGSPLFCYDENRKSLNLIGISTDIVIGKYSKVLKRFIDYTKERKFGLELLDVRILIFTKVDSHREWIEAIVKG